MKFWSDYHQDFVSKEQWQEGAKMREANNDPETMCSADLRRYEGRRIFWAYIFSIFAIWGGNAALCYAFDYHPTLAEHAWFHACMLLLVLSHRARLAALDARARGVNDHWFLSERISKLETDYARMHAELCRTLASSEDRTDKRMRQLEESANRTLARLDQRCDGIDKRMTSYEQRLDATIAKQDDLEESQKKYMREIHGNLARITGIGGPVPYAPGACRDAADADGAIFDALELVAKKEHKVPEHIEVGDKIVVLQAGMILTGEVLAVRPAAVQVRYRDWSTDSWTSRDDILAHQPK